MSKQKTVFEKMSKTELKAAYAKEVKNFKTLEVSYGRNLYAVIAKVQTMGRAIDPNYSIKNHLCKDLGISYDRYKFYALYRHINDEKRQLIADDKISENTLLEIVHRFPEKDRDYVIKQQIKYGLSKRRLVHLKKKDRYKSEEEWEKEFDDYDAHKSNTGMNVNRRAVLIWCKNIQTRLASLHCELNKTRIEIYGVIKKTHDVLSDWLETHKDWATLSEYKDKRSYKNKNK